MKLAIKYIIAALLLMAFIKIVVLGGMITLTITGIALGLLYLIVLGLLVSALFIIIDRFFPVD